MATVLQQHTLDAIIRQYSDTYGLPGHKAFLFFVIEKYLAELELNNIEIEEAIIDGPNDCGIDAIVIDDESSRPRIYFFQSKYYQSDNAFSRQFEAAALEKMQSAINDFVLHGRINTSYQNEQLIDKLHSVKNLSSERPQYVIVLCSNSDTPSSSSRARLEEFINDANRTSAGDYLLVEYLHLDRIARDLVAPQQRRIININIRISGKYLTEDTGNVRLFVGAVEGKDLASLIDSNGDDIFERNVRGYLRQINQVNKSIYQTATDSNSPYFVYMNNGLTITCDKFTHGPESNSPTLEIKNAQIVNGQQTARSLHQAMQSGNLREDVKVLVRIVETSNENLLMQIVEATNSQSKVTSRDLHSNDETQKLIEADLASQGYFYESRKNKYRGKEASKRIDAEVAAQIYYAVIFEQPALAKDKKKLLFGEKYDELFNDNTKPADILYCFKLLKLIQDLNASEGFSRFTFLKDATLHIAALMHKLNSVRDGDFINLDDNKLLKKLYNKTTKAIAVVVKERQKEERDKYEHRRTFKDPETFGRVVESLLS